MANQREQMQIECAGLNLLQVPLWLMGLPGSSDDSLDVPSEKIIFNAYVHKYYNSFYLNTSEIIQNEESQVSSSLNKICI